jgi:hypothetical protein
MRRALTRLAGCGAIVLAGCATDPALVRVSYDGQVAHTSGRTASIQLTTGTVERLRGTALSDPRFDFTYDDQRTFVASLRDEINRVKLLRVGPVGESPPAGTDVAIEIVFQRTRHLDQYYFLDAVMLLQSGERKLVRRYQVSSADGESTWTRLNTNIPQGKALAAKKLMARLIPDIEQFVSESR